MTSIVGTYAQIPANKLYINITNIASSIVDSNNNPVPWVAAPAALGLQTAGGAVLRDMGRYIYRPDPTVRWAASLGDIVIVAGVGVAFVTQQRSNFDGDNSALRIAYPVGAIPSHPTPFIRVNEGVGEESSAPNSQA